MKPKRRPNPRPTVFIARELAAIQITEGLLMELGFSLEQRDGDARWVYPYLSNGGLLAPGLPIGYGSAGLELHAGVLESAFETAEHPSFPKPATVLHLMLAAYVAGIHTGGAQTKRHIREALGLAPSP